MTDRIDVMTGKKTMKISETLSRLIKEHGLNTLELSRRTGIGQPVIYRIMSGETDNPKIATVCALADYFKLTVNQLIGETPLPGDTKKTTSKEPAGIPFIDWEDVDNWPLSKAKLNKAERIDSEIGYNPNLYALKMHDDSMDPLFSKNTILIIDASKQSKDRSYMIIKHKDQKKAVFRQVLIDDDFQYLKPLNPDPDKYKMKVFSKGDKYCGALIQAKRDY